MNHIFSNAEYDYIADVNQDGIINILDVITMVNWIINSIMIDYNYQIIK